MTVCQHIIAYERNNNTSKIGGGRDLVLFSSCWTSNKNKGDSVSHQSVSGYFLHQSPPLCSSFTWMQSSTQNLRLSNGGADMATQMGSSISDFSSPLLKAVVCYVAWVLLAMQCLYTLFLNWSWISKILLYTKSLLIKVKIIERKKCLCCLIYLLFNSALCSWLLI